MVPIVWLSSLRLERLRLPVRDYKGWCEGGSGRFIDENALAIHHIVFCSVWKLEKSGWLTEAMLLEVDDGNADNVSVIRSVKEFFSIAAPARVMATTKGNLRACRVARLERSNHDLD